MSAVVPLFSVGFARAYAVTMRPYLLFVSGITGLAGMALAPPLPASTTLLLGVVFFLSYGFGQALTDCFQTDTDALSAPYRPLVRGIVRRRDLFVVSLIGLLASGAIVAVRNPWVLPLALATIAGLITYTWFKRRWWGGPAWNAGIVALLAVIGWVAALGGEGGRDRPPDIGAVPIAVLAVVFFGYANFVLAGYWKDMTADRATGYETLPVRFGTRVAARISMLLAAVQIAAALVTVVALVPLASVAASIWSLGFLLPGVWFTVRAQHHLARVDEAHADVAIVPVVHGYILILAGLTALQRPVWAPFLWLFFLGWLIALRRRPMARQI